MIKDEGHSADISVKWSRAVKGGRGNGRKREDRADSATHYIIQAKICLSCSRADNCSLFAAMSTFRVRCPIRPFDRVVNIC